MAGKAESDVRALLRAVAENPTDPDARLVLADALEEQGGLHDAPFQRLLVAFVRFVQQKVEQRAVPGLRYFVGATDGRVNVRVFVETRHRQEGSGHRAGYAWVHRFAGEPGPAGRAGEVRRGSWRKPEGPVRFHLTDGPQAWALHAGPYGLSYLK